MKALIILLSGMTLFACSSSRVVHTDLADGTDLSSYRTFDFYKLEASGDTISAKYKERTDVMKEAIASELSARGFTQSSADPDLLVNLGIVVNEKVQTRETNFREDAPKYMGQRRYSWKSKEVEVGRYRDGTVTFDLVDNKQSRMVWQGTVEGIIPDNDSKADEQIKEGVTKLFKEFPVKPK